MSRTCAITFASFMAITTVGCSSTPAITPLASATSSPAHVIVVGGYPLDRTLKGLVEYPDAPDIVILDGLERGQAHWTTPDGQPPAVLESNDYFIVTPYAGRVVETLRGSVGAGDRLTMELLGGRIGDVEVSVEDEISPVSSALATGGRFLVAGRVEGSKMLSRFIYSIDATGSNVKSLMKSGSNDKAEFTMGDLRRALKSKP